MKPPFSLIISHAFTHVNHYSIKTFSIFIVAWLVLVTYKINKTLKPPLSLFGTFVGFSYLQNNKTLKRGGLRHLVGGSFSYLQNNKTLKRMLIAALFRNCFSYLQNNKTLKPF